MTIKDFERLVDDHSLFPGDDLYNSNALAGEVGEIANVNKKIKILTDSPGKMADESLTVDRFRAKEVDELGDALFYLIRKMKDNGCSLEEVMKTQREKLILQGKMYGRKFLK